VRSTWRVRLAGVAIFAFSLPAWDAADAQEQPAASVAGERASTRGVQTATIHWQGVPLRDALERLRKVFDTSTFVDRRVDPNTRVSLDIEASDLEQVLEQLAAEHGWGIGRLGNVVYLGPAHATRQLGAAAEARADAISKLSRSQRATFSRKRAVDWPRLATPRAIVTELIEKNDWRVASAERIPHDLWAAGTLEELTFADQLTLLLIGFDLTYEVQPAERTIEIVALDKAAGIEHADFAPTPPTPPKRRAQVAAEANTKQVYSLRVEEKPVGAVARELAKRLQWQIEFDEEAILAAGLSLDARVSFTVENVEQEELLDAVLRPAGLTFRRNGERITVVPR